ncbi:MAG: prefoldin subunit beta, partial [Candidatus Aenigmatarchaeota archaeon]
MKEKEAYQQQIQSILIQKETLNLQLLEIQKALEDLERTGDKEVFKLSGPILLKMDAEEVKKELKEKEELLKSRIASLEKLESQVKEKLK